MYSKRKELLYSEKIEQQALQIFQAGLAAVDPVRIIHQTMVLDKGNLIIRSKLETRSFDLNDYKHIVLIGYGKASARMAQAVEGILGSYIQSGLIVTKYGHSLQLQYCEIMEAGHPIPDAASYEAGRRIYDLCVQAKANTLIINLVSGGGSALLEYSPLPLKTLQDITQELLEAGVDIHTMNIIRSTLSSIKAGKLAEAMYPAQSINLMLSDVLGEDPSTIASGPTVPASNKTEREEKTQKLLDQYSTSRIVVKDIVADIEAYTVHSTTMDTNTKKKDGLCWNVIIANNYHALKAAEAQAKVLRYTTLLLSSRFYGEASELGKFYAALAANIHTEDIPVRKPACIISGGESTVHITGSGRGGRNQEMALSFANEATQQYHHVWGMQDNYAFASLASDGSDGTTDAAGAIVTFRVLEKAMQQDLSFEDYLNNNDSYTFFQASGGLYKSGPTGTNICDIQILIMR